MSLVEEAEIIKSDLSRDLFQGPLLNCPPSIVVYIVKPIVTVTGLQANNTAQALRLSVVAEPRALRPGTGLAQFSPEPW